MGANSSNLADDDAFASDQKSSNNTSLGNASENGSKSTVMIQSNFRLTSVVRL